MLESSSQPAQVTAPQIAAVSRGEVLEAYRSVRRATEGLCQPLVTEDYVVQVMPDASPVKWHLAHTSWFFETFVLGPCQPGYRPFAPEFDVLFNSYYNAVGPRWPRPQRGLLSRPTVDEVFRYRVCVDAQLEALLQSPAGGSTTGLAELVTLGLNHEQQHQELILTDVKSLFALNPLQPVYQPGKSATGKPPPLAWLSFPARLAEVGHEGQGFAFDNESPRHRVLLQGFRLASRLVTNGEYLEFINDRGYERPELWLSDGWAARQAEGWDAPLYWQQQDGNWLSFTLSGLRPLDPGEPVCHVSYYEADAYARWAGACLPGEAEWEVAAATAPLAGHFLEGKHYHPASTPSADDVGPVRQLFGDVWQWTASPYVGYPGYLHSSGALGEYNGKFMCNQFVLRGASCVTPRAHARRTYRNFFPPSARWQFTGIRLAKEQS